MISARGGHNLVMAAMLEITKDVPRYDSEAINHSEVELFADAKALRDGDISLVQLHRKNGLLAFPRENLSVDFAGFLERPR